MPKIKICDLTQAYAPSSGGIRTYLQAKRAYLRERDDFEHILLVPGPNDRIERDGALTLCEIAAPRLPAYPPYRCFVRPDKVLAALHRFAPDLIEIGSPDIVPWLAFQYQRRRPCRLVGFYHADFPRAYVESALASRLGPQIAARARGLAYGYARAVYNRCDATIAATPALRDLLTAQGIAKVHCIPLGVDLDLFNPARRDAGLRRDLGLRPGELMLVFTGRHDHEKRIAVMIDAMAKLPESLRARLFMLGEGPLREPLLQSNNPRVVVLPYQNDKHELARLLASADIYLSAAPHETFGLSVIEAQACGLPVVGVRAGALIERVPEGLGLLGPIDDAGAMAVNILRLAVADPRGMGHAARAHVAAEYSWQGCFDRICGLYLDLVNQPLDASCALPVASARPDSLLEHQA